jgi:hypothetical protein
MVQWLNKQNSQELKTCMQVIVYTLIGPFISFRFLFMIQFAPKNVGGPIV